MAKRTRGDGGTPATVALAAAGIAFTACTYAHDPAAASYGLEAAEALGVEPARVLKTLLAEGETGLAVGIVPVGSSTSRRSRPPSGSSGCRWPSLAPPS